MHAGGSTNLYAGLRTALSVAGSSDEAGGGRRVDVLLISDGLPTEGPESVSEILDELDHDAGNYGLDYRLFGLGIGSNLDHAFIAQLTRASGGDATFALDDGEIGGQVAQIFSYTSGGVMSDVDVTVRGAGLADARFWWRFRRVGQPLHLAAKGQLRGAVDLRLQASGPDDQTISTSDSIAGIESASAGVGLVVPALAAKAWADRMAREIDAIGESEGRVAAALELAKQYGIVTRYSSLLALESDQMYADYGVKQIARDPAGIALEAVGGAAVDEGRIGGAGTHDQQDDGGGDALGDGGDWESGAGCRAATPPANRLIWAWLALLGAAGRRSSIR